MSENLIVNIFEPSPEFLASIEGGQVRIEAASPDGSLHRAGALLIEIIGTTLKVSPSWYAQGVDATGSYPGPDGIVDHWQSAQPNGAYITLDLERVTMRPGGPKAADHMAVFHAVDASDVVYTFFEPGSTGNIDPLDIC